MVVAVTTSDRVIIVGSGAAGLSTAVHLRGLGYTGSVVILGEESGGPYDRPPLSKRFLSGEEPLERVYLRTLEDIRSLNIELIAARACRLDLEQSCVVSSLGTHEFSEVVVASGSRARPLFGGPPGVHVLRTVGDAARLRESLIPGSELAVIGGGFLGLEVASTARKMGVSVTVAEPMVLPLQNRVPRFVAERIRDLHLAHGVKLMTGVSVESVVGDGRQSSQVGGLVLADGRTVEADTVLVAVGSVPEVAWLEGSGLRFDDGLVCDAYCQAAPRVWGAGDVARWFHPGLGRLLRIEHRTNASEQAAVVAANIVGEHQVYAPVPFFWTDQFDVKLQVWGLFEPGLEFSFLSGSADSESFLLGSWSPDGVLCGLLAWNAAREAARTRSQLLPFFVPS